ncbi:hypothetical protein P0F65_11300 [Sphingomonas sp. I4]
MGVKGSGMRVLAMMTALAMAGTAMQPVLAQGTLSAPRTTARAPRDATPSAVEYDIAFPAQSITRHRSA